MTPQSMYNSGKSNWSKDQRDCLKEDYYYRVTIIPGLKWIATYVNGRFYYIWKERYGNLFIPSVMEATLADVTEIDFLDEPLNIR